MEKKFGPMMQMAFVVDDFDAPIEFWTKKMNIGPFFKLEHLNVKDVYYMNKPTNLDFSVAIAYTGSMQIELVNQHCDCLLYTSPSPRDLSTSRMPSSA